MNDDRYDWIIIGSGFGGSVSALRLSEKGYRVLVIEKGRRFTKDDFPEDNRDLKNWMWNPALGLKGIFKMSFFKHVTVVHGVGVGGGSLVYANTLPTPKPAFFNAASWGHLADWEDELKPHYAMAKHMLGATPVPITTKGDKVIREIAQEIGREEHHHPTEVSVFFGDPNKRVPDPYFNGEGPDRVGCNYCGACMTGCKVGAKNTLDHNYLYLAEKLGAEVVPETEVTAVRPTDDGYRIETQGSFDRKAKRVFESDRVIFSGGVLGTIPLLLQMQEDPAGLPELSERLGDYVRTNSEALIGVVSTEKEHDFSKGVAITSILHTDEHSHLEPVRYGQGSTFFRRMMFPHSPGSNIFTRFGSAFRSFFRQPVRWLKAFTVRNYAQRSQILLYMRTLEGTLRLKLGRGVYTGFRRKLVTDIDAGVEPPKAFMEEATDLANRFAEKVKGVAVTLITETLFGTPSTAHILGGACMGDSADTGVINHKHEVYGYDGLYVIDGSSISANPGVNPSLTITALAERAMTFVPKKIAVEDETAPTKRDEQPRAIA